MPNEFIPPQKVSTFIDYLKKTKDPAVVGLRRILKKKEEAGKDFPLKSHHLQEFSNATINKTAIFDENEQRILELEKQLIEQKEKLSNQSKKAEGAIKQAFQEGYKNGVKKGEKTGFENAEKEYNQQLELIESRLQTMLKNIENSRKELMLDSHKFLLELVVVIAQKVINTEISINKEIILSVIKKALSFIVSREELTLRVSPNDLDTVTNNKNYWASIAEHLETISIKTDERIAQGGCIIESNAGIADARLDVQVNEIISIIETTWNDVQSLESDEGDETAEQGLDNLPDSDENTSDSVLENTEDT